MKFQIIAAAIGLSLLATPGCKQLKCGTGTVEKDGMCVIPKPKDCGKVALTKEEKARWTIVKTELPLPFICNITLQAKFAQRKRDSLRIEQYDKDGTMLVQYEVTPGEIAAGKSTKIEVVLKKGVVKTKLGFGD